MARDLLIDIRATDSASPVFVKLGQTATDATNKIDAGAEKAGQELTDLQSTVAKMEAAFEKHASESGQAMTDLRTEVKSVADTVQTSATEMGRSFEAATDRIENAIDGATRATKEAETATVDYGRASAEMLRGVALLGTAFTMYAGQARAHEVTILALQRIYGDAADSYVEFAETIQNTTIFSNDEALEAARIMGTLRENYDLTDAQIKQLISTSADLATMHGFTLADAAQRVSSAIRGEAESAEMLGLTMNQAAIDSNNLTLSMSNAEAGAFRFDALMQQAESSIGAAGEAAESNAGKTQQMANRFQDAAVDVVNFTGPVGQAAGVLSSFGLEAGLAAGGLAQLGKGLMALKGTASIATLVASLAGPAGIAVAAGVAGYALWQLFSDVEDAGVVAFNKATEATGDLSAAIEVLISNIGDARIGLNLLGDDETFRGLTAEIERQLELFEKWGDPSNFQNGIPLNWVDTGNPADLAAARAEWEELIALNNRLGDSTQTMAAQVAASYEQIIQNTGEGSEAALQTAMNWVDAFQAGEISLVELNDRLNGVIADFPNYARVALEARAAQEELNEAIRSNTTAADEQRDSVDWLTESWIAQEVALNDAAAAAWRMQQAQSNANDGFQNWLELHGLAESYNLENAPITLNNAYRDLTKQLDIASLAMSGIDLSAKETGKSFADLVPEIDQASRAALDFDAAFGNMTGTFDDKIVSMKAAEEAYRELAVSIRDSMGALDPSSILGGTMSGIVGAAQGFASTSQSVADWAGGLAHGNFLMTKLDQLFLDGAISGKTYRDALDANHRIQEANNDVQEDSLRIQAKQLPLMAQLAEEQAAYVDSIADMSAEQQLVVLGFMDQTKAAQAFSLAQLAASSSTDAMQDSTTGMISAIAEADPVMKAMLIDMGLISEGADGTITVNFGDVDEGQRALETLNNTVMGFALLISEAFGIEINLDDNDSIARLLSMEEMLRRLDGRSVTSYATVITTGFNAGTLADAGRASTGTTVTDRYVTGGTHGGSYAITGEHGPELLWLPNGAQVTNAPASREPISQMRGGGSGVQNIYKGPVQQVITVNQSALQSRAERLSRSRR